MCTQAAAPECSTPAAPASARNLCVGFIVARIDIRRLFSRQIAHVDEAVLPQPAQIYGVVNALPAANADGAPSGDQPFGLKCLDMCVDLPVVHADALCDVSRRVAVKMLGQVPDNSRPQGIGVEHAQSPCSLLRLPGHWLVDAGHSSILTHRRALQKHQHIFGNGSITLNMMLGIAAVRQESREGGAKLKPKGLLIGTAVIVSALVLGLILSFLLLFGSTPAAADYGPAVSVVIDGDSKIDGYTEEVVGDDRDGLVLRVRPLGVVLTVEAAGPLWPMDYGFRQFFRSWS